jgi:hypothetical protein
VFLSHAHEDKPIVKQVSNRLAKDNFITWLDKKDLLPGDDWRLQIHKAIEKFDFFLAFLSAKSVDKVGYFQKELKLAMEQRALMPEGKRYIIPILIGTCEVPQAFKDIHWLRIGEPGWYKGLRRAMRGNQ